MIREPGKVFNPLKEIPLSCEYADYSFRDKLVRAIPDAISYMKENPDDLAFFAGVAVAAASVVGLGCAIAPVLLTPMVIYNPPILGFAGYTVTNAILGAAPALVGGYQLNKLCAEPPADMDAWREEGRARKVVRVAAKFQLITLASGALGAAFIPAGHALGLILPLY
ncbi:hypothetical protein M3P05_16485 [Sansalvadorimonas sp. 2012CJ34-2]|uniref:Uncharacterized protein n=1 Tax=Parendozoicomonas callyspongiae TaxID=2942213 RepID=A0ABT0PJV7_9GAMM|nr:hypothetical protein [Sansalvadorimonas sp. 2012CJ34-2]MCL6271516.1 hypothetical protein [Sansalvadorimonas sp. 2012CJ34-2]